MHIVFNGWFWDQPYTGSGQYVRRLLAALCEAAPQHRYTLVIPKTDQPPEAVPAPVNVHPVPLRGRGHLGKVWFEQRALPAAVRSLRPDVLHVPYWGPPLSAPAPIVCSVLDVIPLVVPAYRAGFLNRLYTSLVTAGARGAAHVITISEAARQDIVRTIGIPPERISVTHLAADPRFRPAADRGEDAALRARLGLDDVDDFVLYLGSYAVHKNLELLLAAYTYVAQGVGDAVPLVLAGHTPAAWGTDRFPDLPALIDELGLGDYVRWIGPVDEADKAGLYRLAAVFAFPSRYEGFGLPPLEAMASGTPVVGSDASSIPEIVGDAGFLVDPADSRAMAGAILSLLLEPDTAAGLRERGVARARAFSWQQTAAGTLDVYRRVISAQG